MKFNEPIPLGRTGLIAGRLGVSASYGVPAAALEEAFERGCNYFNWGIFMYWQSGKMREAIRQIVKKGKRDKLILAIVSFPHQLFLTERYFIKALKNTGTDYADILLLGGFLKHPSAKIIEGALRMKEKGLCHHIGLTSHNRKLFAELRKENIFDVFHVLYNAAYREVEIETFPFLQGDNRPGIVTFTATCWGQLLKANNFSPGELLPTAADCYRFVLSNPMVDICLTAPKNIEQMRQNLVVLDLESMEQEELKWMHRIAEQIDEKKKEELNQVVSSKWVENCYPFTLSGQFEDAIKRFELNQAYQKALLATESEKLFKILLDSVTHELRTPITSISTAASALIDKDMKKNPQMQSILAGEIMEASDRLNHLVGNLLDTVRLESGKLSLDLHWYDAAELVGVVHRKLGNKLSTHHFICDIAEDIPAVEFDFVLMEQVLYNLLLNAIIHTPKETDILLNIFVQDDRLMISVKDKGQGIKESEINKIFDKFYKVQCMQSGGLGLGLSICKGIVELHKGTIHAENNPDCGANFMVSVPLRHYD